MTEACSYNFCDQPAAMQMYLPTEQGSVLLCLDHHKLLNRTLFAVGYFPDWEPLPDNEECVEEE